MSKLTWKQTDEYHNATIAEKQVGCCWQSWENTDVYHYVSHKGTGQVSSLEEAKKRIEELNAK